MRTIHLHNQLPDDEAAALAGTLLGDDSYDILVQEDADVFKPDGTPLLHFRKAAIPMEYCLAAWQNLRDAATPTDNRGIAAGVIQYTSQVEGRVGARTRTRYRRLKQDGTLSNTNDAISVNSGIVGYFDRNARFPYCRTTAYNLQHPERFHEALPFIRAINDVFRRESPERWAAQNRMIQQTHPDFTIHGTVFTTVTVNKNWQTAVHTDKGDYAEGFGVLTALCAGEFDGCYFCLPKYRVAVDMRTSDVLLADVHEWHGNTPLRGLPGTYERLSFVLYYRENMFRCKSAEEELAWAKNRKPGEALNAD